jgi:hypothetical protein
VVVIYHGDSCHRFQRFCALASTVVFSAKWVARMRRRGKKSGMTLRKFRSVAYLQHGGSSAEAPSVLGAPGSRPGMEFARARSARLIEAQTEQEFMKTDFSEPR